MSASGNLKRYLFTAPHHWSAGLYRQLEAHEQGLTGPGRLVLHPVDLGNLEDRNAAVSFDPAGRLYWVRRSLELLSDDGSGQRCLGRLSVPSLYASYLPMKLVVGFKRMWLLITPANAPQDGRLFSFDLDDLCPRSSGDSDWQINSITGDREDGVWAVARYEGVPQLVHIDDRGIAPALSLVDAECFDLTYVRCRKRLLVLQLNPLDSTCELPVGWRLIDIDPSCWFRGTPATCGAISRPPVAKELIAVAPPDKTCRPDHPEFSPCRIAIDCEGRIFLLDTASGAIWVLDAAGRVLAMHVETFASRWLGLHGLTASESLAMSGACGVTRVTESDAASSYDETLTPEFLTPALISPDGVVRGWSRAELSIAMDEWTTVEVGVAYTSDARVVDLAAAIGARTDLPASIRLDRLNRDLPWDGRRTRRFHGSAWPSGRPLRVPLHEIDATHLWLRIRVFSSPGARVSVLRSLAVFYPNVSYTRYLPAVFGENEAGARHLRNLVSIFESVLDEIDAELAALPENIDPTTAPASWLPFLLRWLGLPAATELEEAAQRNLLTSAGELLRWRGTEWGLEALLVLLVGPDFRIEDQGAGPAPWVLPKAGRADLGQRLGVDTLVLATRRPGFRLGFGARLGRDTLGFGVLKAAPLFSRRTGRVVIRVAADEHRRPALRSLLERYLPYFIPAHCRYRLIFVDRRDLPESRRLTAETLITSQRPARLGSGSALGELRLPGGSMTQGISVLDRNTFLRAGDVLT